MSLIEYEKLPFDSQRRLDAECARFERGWTEPSPDRLASHLEAAPQEEAETWLIELLHIEVERGRRDSLRLPLESYRSRFPAFTSTVEAVFAQHPTTASEGDTVGKYRLHRLLGRGAAGTVFEAEDSVIGRRVALKVLTGPFAAARTIREARSVGSLQHPNIVTVHDAGEIDGTWFIAMELLSGSAADRLRVKGPFDPAAAARLAADVCRGLVAAHAAGLVHRDIKPANVLLTPASDGQVPVAKLSDFGLALGKTEGMQDAAVGTPQYMAPEQFAGPSAGIAGDIYSLGATFFALLTGQPPFPTTDVASLRSAHETIDPPLVIARSGRSMPVHSRVISRAMAKSTADRYPSASAMLSDLESLSRPTGRDARRIVRVGILALVLSALGLAVPGPAEWMMARIAGEAPKVSPSSNREWAPLFVEMPVFRIGDGGVERVTSDRDYEDFHLRMEVRWPEAHFDGGIRYGVRAGEWDGFSLAPPDLGTYRHSANRDTVPAEFREGRLVPTPQSNPAAPKIIEPGWNRIELVNWGDVSILAVNESSAQSRLRPRSVTPRISPSRGFIALYGSSGSMEVRSIEIRQVGGIPTSLRLPDR